MILARSLAYTLAFYVWSVTLHLIMLPVLLWGPQPMLMKVMRLWARGARTLLTAICGVRVEIRGAEHMPTGAPLIAPKHQCMFDTMAPFAALDDACYVMRKELVS